MSGMSSKNGEPEPPAVPASASGRYARQALFSPLGQRGQDGPQKQDTQEEASEDSGESAAPPEPDPQPAASSPSSDVVEDEYEDVQMVTVKSVSMKWGLYLGLAYIIWTLIMYMTEMDTNTTLQWLSGILFIVGAVVAHKEFKRDGDGYMSYGQGLGIGTLVALISGVISSVFSYVYMKFIDPSVITRMMDASREQMEARGGLSDAQIEQALEISSGFMTPEVLFGLGIVIAVFFGFILSLIISAITKNTNPEAEV